MNALSLPKMDRCAQIRASSFNEPDNSIELVFATSSPVRRRSLRGELYDEILAITDAAIDRSRLDAGTMPLLNSHRSSDISDVIGNIIAGTMRIANGVAAARVRLSTAASDTDVVSKIRSGILSACSVGYIVGAVDINDRAGDIPTWTITRWTPIEVSLVAVGADPNAHIRSAATTFPCVVANATRKRPWEETYASPFEHVVIPR